MSHSISALPKVQISVTEMEAKGKNPASPDTKAPEKSVKLPYQATHQVELLHLHAEVEALLHQVKMVKQQRHVISDSPESIAASSGVPVLARR
ncbi:hypothetical protein IFO70_11110 [Phormidium tenue FACHB-886]|nr:hypothetical protein [Phormidium tenue FACHB-886]